MIHRDLAAPSSAMVQQGQSQGHETVSRPYPYSNDCVAPLQGSESTSLSSKRQRSSSPADANVFEKASRDLKVAPAVFSVDAVNHQELSIRTPGSNSPMLCESGKSSFNSADNTQSESLEVSFVYIKLLKLYLY